ncbi:hypothetical protein LCGC14_2356950 [marine sediment metagenome]|uniref:Uncharacterized protein n=1 Tax=marine sediment metagenome TaxID=412755 RepID=A0A0F9EKB2_9ZZZZ
MSKHYEPMTEKEAIDYTVEVWKEVVDGNLGVAGKMMVCERVVPFHCRDGCPLCQLTNQECSECPLVKEFGSSEGCGIESSTYKTWYKSSGVYSDDERRRAAKRLLSMFLFIQSEYEPNSVLKKLDYIERDVTTDCTVKWRVASGGQYLVIAHRGNEIAVLGLKGWNYAAHYDKNYRLERLGNTVGSFKVWLKERTEVK